MRTVVGLLAVVVGLCGLATSSAAQGLRIEPVAYYLGAATYGTAAYIDARDTRTCVRLGVCHEINPLFTAGPIDQAMRWKLVANGGLLAITTYARRRWPASRPALTAAVWTAAALQIGVIVSNRQQIRRADQLRSR